MNKYLLEIGTEELPYKFVDSGLTQLKKSFEKLFHHKKQLSYYNERHFRMNDGTLDLTPNTVPIKEIMRQNGFVIDGKYAIYKA